MHKKAPVSNASNEEILLPMSRTSRPSVRTRVTSSRSTPPAAPTEQSTTSNNRIDRSSTWSAMTSKNGSPARASSAASTDNPLPSSNRSLRTHWTDIPSRTDNPTQNRSISSARYPTTTTTSSTL